MIKTLTQFYN